jgi:hypothetical protein
MLDTNHRHVTVSKEYQADQPNQAFLGTILSFAWANAVFYALVSLEVAKRTLGARCARSFPPSQDVRHVGPFDAPDDWLPQWRTGSVAKLQPG